MNAKILQLLDPSPDTLRIKGLTRRVARNPFAQFFDTFTKIFFEENFLIPQ